MAIINVITLPCVYTGSSYYVMFAMFMSELECELRPLVVFTTLWLDVFLRVVIYLFANVFRIGESGW